MPNEFKHDPPLGESPLNLQLPPPEEEEMPPRWTAHDHGGAFRAVSRLLMLLIILGMVIIPFTPFAGKIKRGFGELWDKTHQPRVVVREVRKEVEVIKEIPAPPPPLPSKFVPRKDVDIASLYNGISIQTNLQTSAGTYATLEGRDPGAYTVEFQVKVRIPKANDTVAELARVNEHLPKMLPGLAPMLTTAKVSGFYHKLYETKTALVQKNITRLTKILDKHNFFDTETILELQHPQSKRLALLIQSDMDVVADGSDGDRMSTMESAIYSSDYYQPSTSYEWAKVGKVANPLLPRWQSRLDAVKKESGGKGLSSARSAEIKAEIQHLEAEIRGLKTRSSLIAEKDPFIVLSLLFKDYPRVMAHAPSLGDYAAVIHGDKIYPAICGDYGPGMKMGEASLLIAKAINEKATPYIRGEDDLKVTYLIFPGTAEKPFGPPKLDAWHDKISAYLKDIGGLGDGYTLHKWDVQFPKPPAPEPEKVADKSDAEKKTTADKPATEAAPASSGSSTSADKPKSAPAAGSKPKTTASRSKK